jgi:hypothetical protein
LGIPLGEEPNLQYTSSPSEELKGKTIAEENISNIIELRGYQVVPVTSI